ncbi:FeoA family protein [Desulfoplanes formicivorans]|uniref:Iron transporter FeoA n=1 Tax=Desulfoplanes formicivorans TaxID=1592317 RepID=A0A194AK76_9BACT|nr:FeoA family protein [Desulfoplanes formicivorans]GAU09718.1 iron transporter FeoA [Desulfoplanes formicivorans]
MGKTLADLGVGTRARVVGFDRGSRDYRKKLLAMGLIKGTEFMVHRVAPMGDPIEIEVRGYNLSLRKHEAVTLTVEGVSS